MNYKPEHFPTFLYHEDHKGYKSRKFQNQEELDKAGEGWVDSPDRVTEQIKKEEELYQKGVEKLKVEYSEFYQLIIQMVDKSEYLQYMEDTLAKMRRISVDNATKSVDTANELIKDLLPKLPKKRKSYTCSDTGTSLIVDGKTWSFTPMQAAAVLLLHEAYEVGTSYLNEATILTFIDSKLNRLRDVFHDKKDGDKFWKQYIISPRKGVYGLKP